jgi:predicted permease
MQVNSLLAALVPVLFVLLLGVLAGRHKSFDADQVKGFSSVVLGYALPAALFVGMYSLDRATLLRQGPLLVVMLMGYSGLFVALYAIVKGLMRYSKVSATIFSLCMSSSAVPIYGLAVFRPLYGAQSDGVVGMVALVTNIAQISIAVLLLQDPDPAGGAKAGVLLKSVLKAMRSPLVWSPLFGAVLVLANWHLPAFIIDSLKLMGSASAGIAIFAGGLMLAAHKFVLSPAVCAGTVVKIVVQPAIFFGLLLLFHAHDAMARETFVASAMPLATPCVLFAAQHHEFEAEASALTLLTTVAMVVVLPAGLWLSRYLGT